MNEKHWTAVPLKVIGILMGTLPLDKRALDTTALVSCYFLQRILAFFPAICLRITAALAYRCMFAKDYGPYFLLSARKGLRPCLPVLFAKDSVLVSTFACKELCSLFSAIRLQRTIVLVFCYSSKKD